MMRGTILRDPDAETEDYPGLVVHDGRVTGSITAGHSRLPLWTIGPLAILYGWQEVATSWDYAEEEYGLTAGSFADFLANLLENRGEFGRLLCILADVQRRDRGRHSKPWWETKTQRKRVIKQLRRCLDGLEKLEAKQ